jgi:hypothetical protein
VVERVASNDCAQLGVATNAKKSALAAERLMFTHPRAYKKSGCSKL